MPKRLCFTLVAIALATVIPGSLGKPGIDAGSTVWHEYADSRRAFVVAYPPDGRVTRKQPHSVVIQNFETDDLGVGPKGRFYVEIEILDPVVSCKDMVQRPKKVMIGKTQAVTSLGESGGDAPGFHFILCAVRKDHRFSVVVTENDARGRIAKRILSSVRFLDE
jgi:hypothetical protein